MANGSAQDPAQDVAAAFVGRCDAVGDQEGDRARVIGDDLIAEPFRLERVRIVTQQLAHRGVDGHEEVRVVVRVHALDHAGKTVQAHARIDRLHRQWRSRSVRVLLELHEHEVPYLEPAGAVLGVVRDAVRPFAEHLAAIEMQL